MVHMRWLLTKREKGENSRTSEYRDLPEATKQGIRALTIVAGEPWDIPEDLPVEELALWLETWRDDYQAKINRQRRRISVEQELAGFARPVRERYPDLPMDKVEYFLHGKDRARYQVLVRELTEMCTVPLVTRDRQPWHGAV